MGEEIPELLRKFSPNVSKPYSTRPGRILNNFRKIFLGILEKTLIRFKKLQVCHESVLPLLENNFLAEIKLCNVSGSGWKLNGCLGKNGRQICQKRIPRDRRILLRKMKFLSKKKNKTLNSSSELQWNKIVLFCAIIRQGCQNWTLRAQRPFWRKFRSKSSFYILFLEFFAKNLNWTHKLRFCQEGILRVQRNISRNIFKEKPKFRAPSEKIPLFGRVYNVRVAKTVFHVSREIFWEKWIFLAKLEIFDFFLLSSRTSESWQKFSPRIQTDL